MDGACCGPGYASPAEAIKAPREKLLYTIALTPAPASRSRTTWRRSTRTPTARPTHRSSTGWRCPASATSCTTWAGTPAPRATTTRACRASTCSCRGAVQQHPRRRHRHRPARAAPAQGDRGRRDQVESQPQRTAYRALPRVGDHHLVARRREGRGARWLPASRTRTSRSSAAGKTTMGDIPFNYDFWYQPRHNVMVSSEWAAPNTFMPGFDLEEVGHLKYGRRLHFWDFEKREPIETMYLGEDGLIPLEVQFHHDPDSTHGFCGAALCRQRDPFLEVRRRQVGVGKDHRRRERAAPRMADPGAGRDERHPVSMDDRYLTSTTGCTATCASTTSATRTIPC